MPVQHIFLLLSQAATHLLLGENSVPWIFELLSVAIGLSHTFLHKIFLKNFFKYIYSISQTLSTISWSTNFTKRFSSNITVHVLHRKLLSITEAVWPTPLFSPMSSNNAPSSISPKSVPLFSSVSKNSLVSESIVYLSFRCYATSLKYHWFLIHSCYMRPCLKTEIPTHLQRRILYSTAAHCIADSNEQVCSMCCNQQVPSHHKTVAQITHYMQAPYKTLVYGDRLKCQAHLMAAGIF
jgi:hypothetical protein